MSRPTDRQLAFVIEHLEVTKKFLEPIHPLHDEAKLAAVVVKDWLLSLAAPGSRVRLLSEIDACRECRTALKMVDGNMTCTACSEGGAA